MTARLHTRRAALGLIGAAAAAGPALAGLEDCTYGFVSACDIDDILWVGEHVVWIGCAQCPGNERRFVNAILRARPGGPVETIAEARVMRWWPFDDKVYAVVGPHNADSTVLFSLPDFRVLATVEDDGDLYRAGPAILRETRAVLSESVPGTYRTSANFRYGVGIARTPTNQHEVWWMATGQPDTLHRVALLDWPVSGLRFPTFQTFDGSSLIVPPYGRLIDVLGQGEYDVPTLTIHLDGRAVHDVIPFLEPMRSATPFVYSARDGFVIGAGDADFTYAGLYQIRNGAWSQIYSGDLELRSLTVEPGGRRLAWASQFDLPPEERKKSGLWRYRYDLRITEIG
jgi:hypothetical protein